MHGEKCHFHLHVRAPRPSMVRRKFLIKLGNRGENYGPCHISLNATFFWGALQILSRSWELRFFPNWLTKLCHVELIEQYLRHLFARDITLRVLLHVLSLDRTVFGEEDIYLSFFCMHLKWLFSLEIFFLEALLKGMQLCNYLLLNSSFFQRSLFAFA